MKGGLMKDLKESVPQQPKHKAREILSHPLPTVHLDHQECDGIFIRTRELLWLSLHQLRQITNVSSCRFRPLIVNCA